MNDQCAFSYQLRTGDFDFMTRLDSLRKAPYGRMPYDIDGRY
jgi:hypothetical protein